MPIRPKVTPKVAAAAKVKHQMKRKSIEDISAATLDLLQDVMELIPDLREDAKTLSVEALREKYKPLITAQMIQTALVDPDPKARIAASRDIVDRAEGKAKERSEQTHRFENLTPEQVTSLLNTRIAAIVDLEASTDELDEKSTKH